jgi:hypothetical protein
MTARMTKKRALQRAGLAHVAGWVQREDVPEVERLIEKARPVAEAAEPRGAAE